MPSTRTRSLQAYPGQVIVWKVGDRVTVQFAGEAEPRLYVVIYVDPNRISLELKKVRSANTYS